MVEVVADISVIDDGNEIRNADVAVKSSHAHRQLVAKIAHGGQPHAGNPQMFAQRRGGLHVVFVEGDDAIQFLIAREMGHRSDDIGQSNFLGKVKRIVEALARPVGIAQFLGGQQEHAPALALALAHELLAFFVGRDAEDGQRTRVRHGLEFGSGVGGYHDVAHRGDIAVFR